MSDMAELLRIERECFTIEAFKREQILLLLTDSKTVTFVAKVEGDVAGFVIGVIKDQGVTKTGHVLTLDVAPKYWRKGLGMKMLKEIEKIFLKMGAEISYLEVKKDNKAARRLYRKQGYTEIRCLNHYYSKGIHGFRLMKHLF